ncbi:Ycf51 family protein [Leptodesmis sichuanensis]|uniref:Ycf51 family protein n=1 Tax=Leptodesmis sichuanensis TaxID=2906798 RepID=UPI001F261857|nr:Ycf51 family protein [Leptodesmis sichuanensis]UIE37112.1 Ycf51 family protein [Leptodesmis sichuanensis A121]
MSSTDLVTYAQWSGYFTIFCAVIAVLGLVFKWGIRFRLVGVTGFMVVLTAGLFALSLGLYTRPVIPGAVKFTRVFDNGSTNLVIAVSPEITETELEATLRQAASDLYSPGRLAQGTEKMTIRARTVLHPRPGVSQPLYLGEVKRSLMSRNDDQMQFTLYRDQFAQLPKPTA